MTRRTFHGSALGLAALLLVLLLGSTRSASASSLLREEDEPAELPDIVLLLIDTLRADRLHAYGYPEDTSPHIDRLAEQGILFEQASSPAPWTLPSVVSIFTSRFLVSHQVVVDHRKLSPDIETLAECLQRSGYTTASIYRNPYPGIGGLDRGFDTAVRVRTQTKGERVREWLTSIGDRRPFFLYIHNTQPHKMQDVGEASIRRFGEFVPGLQDEICDHTHEYRQLTRVNPSTKEEIDENTSAQEERMAALMEHRAQIQVHYDGAVFEADQAVGEIVAELRAAGRWENTIFLLVADHGEELGDHGGWLHDQSVYDELVRVPFLLRLPGNEHAGRRVRTPVSLVDLFPTVCELIDRPALAEGAQGSSLLPLLEREDPERMRVTAMRRNQKKFFAPYKETRGDINVVVRRGSWKAIWNVEPDTLELYDLATDPAETRDRSGDEPELARAMRDFAERRCEEMRASARAAEVHDELDEATLDALRDLGYVGDEE